LEANIAFVPIASRFSFPYSALPSCNRFLCLALTHKITLFFVLLLFTKRCRSNLPLCLREWNEIRYWEVEVTFSETLPTRLPFSGLFHDAVTS
jgi:hypothetical protein